MNRLEQLRETACNVGRFARRVEHHEPLPPMPPPLPEARVVVVPDRGEIFLREVPGPPGKPTIVLLHGWTLTADLNWFTVFDTVARHGRVVAPDQRGHGRGLRSEQRFSLEGAADDVAALIEHLGAAPAVVLGYSMGGSIALLLWRRHPEVVAGLVLQATGLQWRANLRERALWTSLAVVEYTSRFGTPRGVTDRYLRYAVEESPDLDPYRAWVKGEVRRGDPSDIGAAGRALSAYDARDFAGDIDVPTAVVVTSRDLLIRPEKQRELARAVPGAQTVELDGPHDAFLVSPDEFADATDQALRLVLDDAAPAVAAERRRSRA